MDSSDLYTYEVIEQYLSGTLPKDQKELFEEKLVSDDLLKQKVQVVQVSRNAILQNKLKDLKSLMAKESGKANNNSSINKFWFIGFALLLGGSLYFYITRETIVPKETIVKEESEKISPSSSDKSEQKSGPIINEQSGRSEKTVKELQTIQEKNTPQKETAEEIVEIPKSNLNNTTQNIPVTRKDTIQPVTKEPVDLCKGVIISAEPTLHEPCNGTNEGYIELKDLKGGKKPYKLTINGESRGDDVIFNTLSAGSYKVIVTDYNGCKHQFNSLILKGKDCALKYDFNPNRGEEWQGPVVEASQLTIMNKVGMVVYTKQMNEGEQCTWNGYNQSGVLTPGYFVFMIENKEGKVIKGSITVTE